MVACLERSDENAEFHQIVDFLTTSSIRYALTCNIQINQESDLHLMMRNGIPVVSNDEIFVNLALIGSSGPPKKVGDEAVYTGEDDRVVRAATIASSLEAEQESGNIHKTRQQHLMNHLLRDLVQTAQDLVIQQLKKRVKRLEKALRARTLGMKLFKIGTSKRKGLDKENVSKQGRKSDKTKPMFNDSDFDYCWTVQIVCTAGPSNVSAAGDIFKDEMTTIANTLVAIRSARPRTTSRMIHNVEKEPRRAIPVPTV
ncbi:hypothetical protein Tco_0503834 [Tanacetum coccineum]